MRKYYLIVFLFIQYSALAQNYYVDRTFEDLCNGYTELNDGSFLLFGSTADYTSNSSAIYALKVDSSFQHNWSFIHDWKGADEINSSIELSNGNIVLVGSSLHEHKSYQGVIIVIDNQGNLISEMRLGGLDFDVFNSVSIKDNGNLLIAGSSVSEFSKLDRIWLVEMSPNGQQIIQQQYLDKNVSKGRFTIQDQYNNTWLIGISERDGFWNPYYAQIDDYLGVVKDTIIPFDTNFEVNDVLVNGNRIIIAASSFPNVDTNYANILLAVEDNFNSTNFSVYQNGSFRFEFKAIELLPNKSIRILGRLIEHWSHYVFFAETPPNHIYLGKRWLTSTDGVQYPIDFKSISTTDSSSLVFGYSKNDQTYYNAMAIHKTNTSGHFIDEDYLIEDNTTIDSTVTSIPKVKSDSQLKSLQVYQISGIFIGEFDSIEKWEKYYSTHKLLNGVYLLRKEFKDNSIQTEKIYK